MATIDKIKNDLKIADPEVKKIVNKALKYKIKDGQAVLVKTWTPKRGWHYARLKFQYYHPLHMLYPNLHDKMGRRPLLQGNYILKIRNKLVKF